MTANRELALEVAIPMFMHTWILPQEYDEMDLEEFKGYLRCEAFEDWPHENIMREIAELAKAVEGALEIREMQIVNMLEQMDSDQVFAYVQNNIAGRVKL